MFRYSRSLLNRHGFLGAVTAHAVACVAVTPAWRCYGLELPVLPAGWRAPWRAGRAAVPGSPRGCRRRGAAGPGRSLSRWPPRLRRLPGRVSSTSACA
jgi:hypothetical protein